MALSDRILAMCGGHITGERNAAETTEQDLGLLMAGVTERVEGRAMAHPTERRA